MRSGRRHHHTREFYKVLHRVAKYISLYYCHAFLNPPTTGGIEPGMRFSAILGLEQVSETRNTAKGLIKDLQLSGGHGQDFFSMFTKSGAYFDSFTECI
jgi:hypothetical protein